MNEKVGKCIGSNRQCTGTDGDVWTVDAHQVKHERDSQNRAASADQPEYEAHQNAGESTQRELQQERVSMSVGR